MTPDSLFLMLLIAIGIATAYSAYRSSDDVSSVAMYLYAKDDDHGGITRSQSWMNAVASNFQTASVLVVGIELGFQFGLTMLWMALTFSWGIVLFKNMLKNSTRDQLQHLYKSKSTPYTRMLPDATPIPKVMLHAAIYLAVLGTAIFEIWLTTELSRDIVSAFASRGAHLPIQSENIAYFLGAALTVVLLAYVFYGGYLAVVRTDRFQLSCIVMMLVAVAIGTAFSIAMASSFETEKLIFGSSGSQILTWSFWALILGIIVLNIFWQLLDPQVWQRGQAAESPEVFLASQGKNALFTFLTWSVPTVFGAAMAASGVSQDGFAASAPFVALLTLDNYFNLSNWFSSLSLAIALAGIFAAALSSADTAIIAFVADLPRFSNGAPPLSVVREKAITVTILAAVFAGLLYWISPDIKNAIFAIYSGMMVFVYPMYKFIRSGAQHAIAGQKASNRLALTFVTFVVAGVGANLIPALREGLGPWVYVVPLLAILVGYLVCRGQFAEPKQN